MKGKATRNVSLLSQYPDSITKVYQIEKRFTIKRLEEILTKFLKLIRKVSQNLQQGLLWVRRRFTKGLRLVGEGLALGFAVGFTVGLTEKR